MSARSSRKHLATLAAAMSWAEPGYLSMFGRQQTPQKARPCLLLGCDETTLGPDIGKCRET